ncbi:MAG: hypothetical protein ACLFWD_03465 [Anaerolineales bacterium]
MPRLSVVAVRASLIHLAAGFTLGAIMLINKGLALDPALWGLLPIHIEFLLLGWMAQLAMGVGFWILPRFSGERGNVTLAWLAVVLLNVGLLALFLAGILRTGRPGLLVSRGITALGVLAFAAHAWPRVKRRGA